MLDLKWIIPQPSIEIGYGYSRDPCQVVAAEDRQPRRSGFDSHHRHIYTEWINTLIDF